MKARLSLHFFILKSFPTLLFPYLELSVPLLQMSIVKVHLFFHLADGLCIVLHVYEHTAPCVQADLSQQAGNSVLCRWTDYRDMCSFTGNSILSGDFSTALVSFFWRQVSKWRSFRNESIVKSTFFKVCYG